MNVVLVHDPLYKLGGAERVLSAIHELYPEAPVYTPLYDEDSTQGVFADWDIRTSSLQKLPGRRRLINFYRTLMPLAVEDWDLSSYDLVISSVTSVAKGVITRQDAIHLAYFHNVTRFAWYDVEEHIRGAGFSLVAWPARAALHRFRQWDFLAADRPDYIVANSLNTAKKIEKYYRRSVEEVIHPFVDVERFKVARRPDDFFLIVSRLEPHKRVDLAVAAFNELGLPLKVVGVGPMEAKLRATARPNIDFLGQLSDREVARLMSSCLAFIYPQEEDFGITALEAQASGRPVIAYKKGGALETIIPEVTGEFFAEQSVASLKEAIARFRPERYTPSRIRHHAEKFTRRSFKTKLTATIERLRSRHGI